MKFKDGRIGYVTGWCDTTGWGCQDGAYVDYFETMPTFEELSKGTEWDYRPEDLNKWHKEGNQDLYEDL